MKTAIFFALMTIALVAMEWRYEPYSDRGSDEQKIKAQYVRDHRCFLIASLTDYDVTQRSRKAYSCDGRNEVKDWITIYDEEAQP